MASNSTTNSTNTPVMSPLDGGSSFDTGHDTADAVYHKYLFKSDFDKTKGNAPEVAKPESRPPSANSEIATNNKGITFVGASSAWQLGTPTRIIIALYHFHLFFYYLFRSNFRTLAKLYEFSFYKFNQTSTNGNAPAKAMGTLETMPLIAADVYHRFR